MVPTLPGAREGKIILEPVTADCLEEYTAAGGRAYSDHYTHLWPGGDPDPYLRRNLVPEVVARELANPEYRHWLVRFGSEVIGICCVRTDQTYPGFHEGASLFLDKIYLKKSFTGMGFGSSVLDKLIAYGEDLGKAGIWLKAMQKGPALGFYRRHGFRVLGQSAIPYPEVLGAEKGMWVMGRDI